MSDSLELLQELIARAVQLFPGRGVVIILVPSDDEDARVASNMDGTGVGMICATVAGSIMAQEIDTDGTFQ